MKNTSKERMGCDYCNNTFYRWKSEIDKSKKRNHTHNFCSKECYYNFYRDNPTLKMGYKRIMKECFYCKKQILVKPSLVKKMNFCNRDCLSKGMGIFRKGMVHTELTKEKLRILNLGTKNPTYGKPSWNKGLTKETDLRIQKYIYIRTPEQNKKMSELLKGRKYTEESKIKMSIAKKGIPKPFRRGKNHPNWNNGSSFEPYGIEFNKELKEQIRQRDNFRCQQCFRHQDELFKNTKSGIKKYKLMIHHIDYNKKNNQESNLISLCINCHTQTNFKGREDWTNYFQNKIIGGIKNGRN